MATVQYETVTVDELRRRLDKLSRQTLGISADDFLERYRTGHLETAGARSWRLVLLAQLILAAENGSP
jgi:hypothetical protein